MKLKQFLKQFAYAFAPHKYNRNAEKKLGQAFGLFFTALFIGIMLSLLIFIPVMKINSVEKAKIVGDFSKLSVNFNVETLKPVTLVSNPLIVIDTNANESGNENLLIGSDKNYYKYLFFKKGEKDRNETINLVGKEEKLANSMFLIGLLVLPGYVLAMGVLVALLSIILVLLSSLIAWRVLKKKKFSYRDCFMGALHATIPGILIFLVVLPFFNAWWIVLLLFLILYLLGLTMMKGYDLKSGEVYK